MARPAGSKNARPTKAEVSGYYALLRSAADSGDTQAAAELIKIDHLTSQKRLADPVLNRQITD